jgi:hypothetical protein
MERGWAVMADVQRAAIACVKSCDNDTVRFVFAVSPSIIQCTE